MSDVTRRLAAGAAGVLAALAAVSGAAVVAAAGPDRAVGAGSEVMPPGALIAAPAPEVLPQAAPRASASSAAALERALLPLIDPAALGGSVSLDVVDPVTGEHLVQREPGAARVPASTAKLLTGAAALSLLGPQRTVVTRTVQGADPSTLVLVGAGDVLLARDRGDAGAVNGRAGLGDLARASAAVLQRRGVTEVTLRLDDTAFTGPDIAPGWSAADLRNGFVAPIGTLAVDAGRLRDEQYAPRSGDPALAAARTFAERLRESGIVVSGVGRGTAPEGAETLAQVRSASIGDLVEYALRESDNTVSEVLARLVAQRAGVPTDFASAGSAVLAQAAALGAPVDGAVLVDGSGLGDGSVLTAAALTRVLALAAGPEHPELRPLLTGLPVAGVSGTLRDRFADTATRPAAGVVRAKTGTLIGVSSLAGTVVDADGRLVVFAVLADGVPTTAAARRALDELVTRLAACGCR